MDPNYTQDNSKNPTTINIRSKLEKNTNKYPTNCKTQEQNTHIRTTNPTIQQTLTFFQNLKKLQTTTQPNAKPESKINTYFKDKLDKYFKTNTNHGIEKPTRQPKTTH